MTNQNKFFDLVIFDCDGVLVDSELLASLNLAKALSKLGHPHTAQQCRDRYTGNTLTRVAEIVNASGGPALPDDFAAQVRAHDWAVFEAQLTAIDGVGALLDRLDDQDVPYCVASNGLPEKIQHSLELVGLWDRFAGHAFSAAHVANGKPAPDLFELTAKTMGVAPNRCVVIEDSVLGVTAGVAAGITTVGFLGGGHISPATGAALLAAGANCTQPHMEAVSRWLMDHTASA